MDISLDIYFLFFIFQVNCVIVPTKTLNDPVELERALQSGIFRLFIDTEQLNFSQLPRHVHFGRFFLTS